MSDAGIEPNESNTDGTESAKAVTENATSGATSTAGDNFKAITSQRELEAALKERLDRERAKFKDYNDLKAKAAEFDKVAEAQKSEQQKLIERVEAAEKEAATLRAAREISDWKTTVVKNPKYAGIPAEVLRGSTLEEIEEHAASLKALLPDPRKAGQVPAEGRTVTTGSGDPAQQFAELIRSKTRQG